MPTRDKRQNQTVTFNIKCERVAIRAKQATAWNFLALFEARYPIRYHAPYLSDIPSPSNPYSRFSRVSPVVTCSTGIRVSAHANVYRASVDVAIYPPKNKKIYYSLAAPCCF